MSYEELVNLVAEKLSDLDNLLISPEVNADPAGRQLLTAMRNHLDDQQRELVKEQIDDDDAEFKAQTGLIEVATAKLQDQLDEMDKIDSIVNTIASISAALDKVLKIVPV